MLHELTLIELGKLDSGRIPVAFDQTLNLAISDMRDRPGAKDKRVITLEVSLTPVCDEHGELDTADVDFVIKSKLPARKSKQYSMGLRSKRVGSENRDILCFNELADDNANQRTLDELTDFEGDE